MNPKLQVGDHYLVELDGCDAGILNSEEILRVALLKCVDRSGAKIIKEVFHSFSPHGVTGVIVIAESHVSIHTWPEHLYAAVDIFTCSKKMDVALIIAELKLITLAKNVTTKQFLRGPQN